MTFQEALNVIYAPTGTHDQEALDSAVRAVKWYENNVLELEDYETDQLYQASNYIKKNNL